MELVIGLLGGGLIIFVITTCSSRLTERLNEKETQIHATCDISCKPHPAIRIENNKCVCDSGIEIREIKK